MTIEQRLDRLEQQNRFMKRAGAALLLAVMGVAVMGAGQQAAIPDVIKARAFHVIGKDGAVLVKLEDSLGDGIGLGGTVTTANGKGQAIVRLSVTTEGIGIVTTMNGTGQEIVRLSVTTKGIGMVTTMNGKGQTLVELGVSTNGEGTVTTMNRKGQDLVMLGVTTSGDGTVTTKNGKGQNLVELGASTEGLGLVTAYDPSGRRGYGRLQPRTSEPTTTAAHRQLQQPGQG